MRKMISGLFLFALFISGVTGGEPFRMADASEVSNDRSDREREGVVRGILDEWGSDFVVVDGVRHQTAPRVIVKNEQGEITSSGMKELSPQMMIELVLERHLVVQIRIVSLPR